MKISVIIPAYNCEKYLSACLDSVLQQTNPIYEIILINDGSTDGTALICDQYAHSYPCIQVTHQENRGVSSARNTGLQSATGDLISFIDADDTLEEDMYELLVNTLLGHNADIVHCGYKRLDEQNMLIREVSGTHNLLVQNGEEAVVCLLQGMYFSNGLWNKLFRRELIQDLYFCESLKNNEDVLFNVAAFARARKTVFIDETKYHYFEHPTSACNQLKALKQIQDSISAAEQMLSLVTGPTATGAVLQRIYDARFSLLRHYVCNRGIATSEEIRASKQHLTKAYTALPFASFRCKFNHHFLSCSPFLYRAVYRIYDSIRKPNWDVKS
jgi:glycosyltransferase involved in cell wall biosynthesis